MEMMDRPAIHTAEALCQRSATLSMSEALLIVELDDGAPAKSII
jgi:hypothetical protein